jgi:hypothetical protein
LSSSAIRFQNGNAVPDANQLMSFSLYTIASAWQNCNSSSKT